MSSNIGVDSRYLQLGNVGVIASGLFIWLTTFSWRYYSDPLISLLITFIIFSSALPLVKSASFILLQGTPSNVPLDDLRRAIMKVPGIVDVHGRFLQLVLLSN